tara:strand:+ start:260 stop:529 length:270 start_codon:yes stop_codon:yes gene_type:complete
MKKYSVIDVQEDSCGYMEYTWLEPMTAHQLRKHFLEQWNDIAEDSGGEKYRYCDVTLKNIQEFQEIRLIEFGTKKWAEYNDSDIVDYSF